MRIRLLHRGRARTAITLVELLVVVAIIGLLIALVLPAVQAARESARRAQCQNNLRQLGVAMETYAAREGAYPVGCIGCMGVAAPQGAPAAPLRYISWNSQLLPHLEESNLWKQFNFSLPSHEPANRAVGAQVVPTFLCPSTEITETNSSKGAWKGAAFTDYGGIYGVEGPAHAADPHDANNTQWLRRESLGVMVYEEAVMPRQVTDGLSKTASIAEASARRLPQETEWINGHNVFAQEGLTPINGPLVQINEIGSPHAGGAMLAYCDGHVEFVSEATDQPVLNALLTKAGGE